MSARKVSHSAGSSPGRMGLSERRPCLTALREERSLPSSERGPVLGLDMATSLIGRTRRVAGRGYQRRLTSGEANPRHEGRIALDGGPAWCCNRGRETLTGAGQLTSERPRLLNGALVHAT